MILLVMGCNEPKVRTVVDYRIIIPPESLLTPCPDVKMEMKTNGEMVMTLIELHTQYMICSDKVKSLIYFYALAENKNNQE